MADTYYAPTQYQVHITKELFSTKSIFDFYQQEEVFRRLYEMKILPLFLFASHCICFMTKLEEIISDNWHGVDGTVNSCISRYLGSKYNTFLESLPLQLHKYGISRQVVSIIHFQIPSLLYLLHSVKSILASVRLQDFSFECQKSVRFLHGCRYVPKKLLNLGIELMTGPQKSD